MAAPVLAVILWIVLTVCVVLLTKNYAIKQSGVSPRTFWRWGLRGYVGVCALASATMMLAIYALVTVIA